MTETFIDAFYQIDTDEDGVVTKQDLENYVREKNLKEAFIKKWLTLFADDNEIIYFDSFCQTLGIVPKKLKSDIQIYKMDMETDTHKSILEIVTDAQNRDPSWSNVEDSVAKIRTEVQRCHGGLWTVVADPNKDDLKADYERNGLIYFAPNANDKPRLLIYRMKQFDNYQILKADITPDTQYVVLAVYRDESSPEDTRNALANRLGGEWQVFHNPTEDDLEMPYDRDGLIYFSTNKTGEPKALVFKECPDVRYPCKLYRADMGPDCLQSVLRLTSAAMTTAVPDDEYVSESLTEQNNHCTKFGGGVVALRDRLRLKHGGNWAVIERPSVSDVDECRYAEDGLLYFSPTAKFEDRLLIYREMNPDTDGKQVVYEVDMSDGVRNGVLKLVGANYEDIAVNEETKLGILRNLNDMYGENWNMLVNPTEKQRKVKYGIDGRIYFTPDNSADLKLLVWREDQNKVRGSICCC